MMTANAHPFTLTFTAAHERSEVDHYRELVSKMSSQCKALQTRVGRLEDNLIKKIAEVKVKDSIIDTLRSDKVALVKRYRATEAAAAVSKSTAHKFAMAYEGIKIDLRAKAEQVSDVKASMWTMKETLSHRRAQGMKLAAKLRQKSLLIQRMGRNLISLELGADKAVKFGCPGSWFPENQAYKNCVGGRWPLKGLKPDSDVPRIFVPDTEEAFKVSKSTSVGGRRKIVAGSCVRLRLSNPFEAIAEEQEETFLAPPTTRMDFSKSPNIASSKTRVKVFRHVFTSSRAQNLPENACDIVYYNEARRIAPVHERDEKKKEFKEVFWWIPDLIKYPGTPAVAPIKRKGQLKCAPPAWLSFNTLRR